MYVGPHIPQDNLKVYLDITNPDCYQANNIVDPIADDVKLYNLADRTYIDYFYNDYNTEAYQETVTPTVSPLIVLQHNTREGGSNRDTTWVGVKPDGTSTIVNRVLSYTFICWFKFDNVNQQSENIYGGGFTGRLSFYMSSGGTSESSAVLVYSAAGGANSFTAGMSSTINDGNWHMRAFTITGPTTGVTTCKTYVDGNYSAATSSNSSFVAPTDGTMRWGSWTNGYGNMGGQLNGFMYYEKVLSDNEIKQVYNATKEKYGV